MKISAPDEWLDRVDLDDIRRELESLGFQYMDAFCPYYELRCEGVPLRCFANGREWTDWRPRLLETIEVICVLRGSTAAEWFDAYWRRV